MANILERVRGVIQGVRGVLEDQILENQEVEQVRKAQEAALAQTKKNAEWEGLSPEEQAKRMSGEWHHF